MAVDGKQKVSLNVSTDPDSEGNSEGRATKFVMVILVQSMQRYPASWLCMQTVHAAAAQRLLVDN